MMIGMISIIILAIIGPICTCPKLPRKYWTAIGIAIQIVTLPVILYHFFEFPFYGLFLNLVVIPLMAYAAGSGIISVGIP